MILFDYRIIYLGFILYLFLKGFEFYQRLKYVMIFIIFLFVGCKLAYKDDFKILFYEYLIQ